MALSEFMRSTLSRVVGATSGPFPYSLGERVLSYEGQTIWSLYSGTKNADNTEVSILAFDCKANQSKLSLAKNAFSKLRSMRHPDLLRYIDGIETDSHIYIATDHVVPLQDYVSRDSDENLIAWGLFKLSGVLNFLNADCSTIHGNVRPSSVFVNSAGEWKLGGFEILSRMDEEFPPITTSGNIVPDLNRVAPPEVQQRGWDMAKKGPITAVDAWLFGAFVHELFNGTFNPSTAQSARGKIPPRLFAVMRSLLNPSPDSRMSLRTFQDVGLQSNGYFCNEFVQSVLFLENLNVKDSGERDAFLRKLEKSTMTYPAEFSRNKILPELLKALEFGSAGSKTIGSIIKISETLDDEEYDRTVTPILIRMFTVQDRLVRLSLLEHLGPMSERLAEKVINNNIYPQICGGFVDSTPILREATLKSILILAPKISPRLLSSDLTKHLARLAMDPEPGIRTNTIVCLGKISKYFDDSTRKQVLLPAFFTSLRDPFTPARVASLMAISATMEYYLPQDCAAKIMPNVSALLIDPSEEVRTQAFKAIRACLAKLEMYSSRLGTEVKAKQEMGSSSQSGGNAEGYAGAAADWAGWAVSSLAKKVVSGVDDAGDRPRSAPGIQAPMQPLTPTSPTSSAPRQPYKHSAPITPTISSAPPPVLNPSRILDMMDQQTAGPSPADDFNDFAELGNGDGWDVDIEEFSTGPPQPRPTPYHAGIKLPAPISAPIPPPSAFETQRRALDAMPVMAPTVLKKVVPGISSTATSAEKAKAKADRAAELDRAREERRQRMENLRREKAARGGFTG